jgi:hypothetical protein
MYANILLFNNYFLYIIIFYAFVISREIHHRVSPVYPRVPRGDPGKQLPISIRFPGIRRRV